MKGSITKRLILYFTCTLLAFAVIIGILFSLLFTGTMTQHNKEDLEKRANVIASTLSGFLEGDTLSSGGKGPGHGNGQGGFGAFLKLADELAMGEVWLVDINTSLITRGEHSETVTKDSLPTDGDHLIADALGGKTGFSESFSEAVGTKSITVCVPAFGTDGNVLAAVLLHAPVSGIQESMQSGLWILAVSLAVALVLSVFIAVLLSKRFIRPIKAISATAKQLTDGDYTGKTAVRQADEIGELASTMDVLSGRLLAAQSQQEQLEAERQAFYADVSHELRTPLTVMRGSLEALKDGKIKVEEKQQEYYSQMIAETTYMQNMVNDLLDFSKLKNHDYTLNKEQLNLSDVLSDAVRSIRRIAEQKRIEIKYENPVSILKIQGNYEKLRQMFLIVLDNAVKFSPKDEIISVSTQKEKNSFIISICDKGSGIDSPDLPYIFDRFYKDKTDENNSGTGIGLAIAKQIADRHSIEIIVNSEKGQGTCFLLVCNETH